MFNEKEYQKEYRHTEKNKESRKKYMKKYKQTEKYKDYWKKYRQTEKYKDYRKKYLQTERCKFAKSQKSAMRRNLGFVFSIDLDTEIPDEPVDYHHVNDNLVYPIPTELHNLAQGKHYTLEQHRFYCYQIIKQLYNNN